MEERLPYAKMVLHDSGRITHPHWNSRIEALRKRLWKTNYWTLKMVKSVNRGMKSSRRWKPSGNQLYVHTFEQSTQYTACTIVTRSSNAQQLQDQLLLLQKTALYARYGGVFAHVCKQLKGSGGVQQGRWLGDAPEALLVGRISMRTFDRKNPPTIVFLPAQWVSDTFSSLTGLPSCWPEFQWYYSSHPPLFLFGEKPGLYAQKSFRL